MVSSTAAGVIVQIIDVLAFPPSEDCKIRVSLESRNGMKLKRQNANVIGVSKAAMQTLRPQKKSNTRLQIACEPMQTF